MYLLVCAAFQQPLSCSFSPRNHVTILPEADASHLVKLQLTISKTIISGNVPKITFMISGQERNWDREVSWVLQKSFWGLQTNVLMAVVLLPNAVLLLPSEKFALIISNSTWKLFMYCSYNVTSQSSTRQGHRLCEWVCNVVQHTVLLRFSHWKCIPAPGPISVTDAEEKFMFRLFWPCNTSFCVKPSVCEMSLNWNWAGFNQQFGHTFCLSVSVGAQRRWTALLLYIFSGRGRQLIMPWELHSCCMFCSCWMYVLN